MFFKIIIDIYNQCIQTIPLCLWLCLGEAGLMICQICKEFPFDGYQGAKEETNKKIIRDVFKKGDAFFNSGDIFGLDENYFIYFADRLGDTYR